MAPKTTMERLLHQLGETVKKNYESTQRIIRNDDGVISIPREANIRDVGNDLLRYIEEQEQITTEKFEMVCHPDDGLHAFVASLNDSFGQAIGVSDKFSFFGIDFVLPSKTHTITVGFNQIETIPIGTVAIPGLSIIKMDIGYEVNTKNQTKSKVFIQFEYPKMYQPLIDKIKKGARQMLAENSIFARKAINSNFTFIDTQSIDVDRIVYSVQERRNLDALLFQYIENYDMLTKKVGLSRRRIILLTGEYGTGKTLTALKCADVCLKNDWTFINVLPGNDLVAALDIARQYQPSVVFFEDIDGQVNDAERTEKMNTILNTLDGAVNKNDKIVVVLTTNHPEKIHPAMKRPGRIDAFIRMGEIDRTSMAGLVDMVLGPGVSERCDIDELLSVGGRYTPAFVVEALGRATLYAMAEGRKEVTHEDIMSTLRGIEAQFMEMRGEHKASQTSFDTAFSAFVSTAVEPVVAGHFESFKESLNPRLLAESE